jgi:hypothetical protein
MTYVYCSNCCLVKGDYCGPWDDQHEDFSKIKLAHKNCPGFQIGEPKLKGRKNWNHTEIEKAFTDYLISNCDEWIHVVTASVKGPNKICLISQRSKK